MPPAAQRSRRSTARQRAEDQASVHRRTRQQNRAEIAEDYVEAIADLIEASGEARAVDVARRLGVSHVTVLQTVRRLQRDGLVTTQPYRSIFLTPEGRRLAEHSRHRHRVVTAFLESVGVPTAAARADAEGIEHHVSAETLAAFERFLAQHPATAP
jgi:DtxR family manganese transport transcriptional regulator